jgi:hypothetical protein
LAGRMLHPPTPFDPGKLTTFYNDVIRSLGGTWDVLKPQNQQLAEEPKNHLHGS